MCKMALESWELLILQVALGSLISGVILFIFSIIISGMSMGDSDIDSADTDLDFDAGLDIDMGVDVDIDVGIDIDSPDINVDVGHVEVGSGEVESGFHSTHLHNSSAPILLLMSTFLLMFGSIGYPLYQYELFSPVLRLGVSIISPIFFVKIVSYIWRRYLSGEFAYEIPRVKVDNQVKTLTKVDEYGGLVLADTSDIDRAQEQLHLAGNIKMQAKTLPGVVIDRNQIAYVIAIEPNNTLIIDTWPKASKNK
jgi:hypothetical protein